MPSEPRSPMRPPTTEPLCFGVELQRAAVVPAWQVTPPGEGGGAAGGPVGTAVTTRAKERTAMMDWNCILAKVGSLKVFELRKVD